MRTTYVIRNGEFVEKPSTYTDAPQIITDEMPPTRHMGNGKYYTSKKKFRQATKEAGCVEIGNESPLTTPRKPVELDRRRRREDIKRAIGDLRDGRAPRMDQLRSMYKND